MTNHERSGLGKMNSREVPVRFQQGDGAYGENHCLLGCLQADSIVHGVRGVLRGTDMGAGNFQSMESLGETLGADGFDQIVDGLDIEGLSRVLCVGSDQDSFWGRVKGFQEIKAGGAGHLDIQKEGMGLFFSDDPEGGFLGVSLANDLKSGVGGEELTKPLQGKSLVVAKDYTEHGSPSKSSVATTKPFSSVRVKR